MTYEEWLERAPESRETGWVGGEAIEFVPPTVRHQDVVFFLATQLRLFVGLRGFGKVPGSPIEVRLSQRSSREPDVVFVAREHLDRVGRLRIDGAPDLVVEVVFDGSVRRDRVAKRDEYAQAGVREYWIVDCRSGKDRQEFLLLDASGRYVEAPRDAQRPFHSAVVPGFWLDPAWLRADPLPPEIDCLRAIDPGVLGSASRTDEG